MCVICSTPGACPFIPFFRSRPQRLAAFPSWDAHHGPSELRATTTNCHVGMSAGLSSLEFRIDS